MSAEAAVVDTQAVATTILVVDDEIFVRLHIAEVLRNARFRVIEAGNADEALTVLDSGDSIDVLVTDIRMPGSINGIALAAKVRSAWPHMKIIFVTSHSPTWPNATLFDLFIGKPYDPARLIQRVRQLLGGGGEPPSRSLRSGQIVFNVEVPLGTLVPRASGSVSNTIGPLYSREGRQPIPLSR